MKKIYTAVICILLAVSMVSCGAEAVPTDTGETSFTAAGTDVTASVTENTARETTGEITKANPYEHIYDFADVLEDFSAVTLTGEEIKSLATAPFSELREKVNTVGDAVAVLDYITYRFDLGFYSNSGREYKPLKLLSPSRLQKIDSNYYTFATGYMIQDNIPGVECIFTGVECNGTLWPYTGLLIPYNGEYLVLTPTQLSKESGRSNCVHGMFSAVLIKDKSELVENLYTTGIQENARLTRVYTFVTDGSEYSFEQHGNEFTCDNLEPFYVNGGKINYEPDYRDIESKLTAYVTNIKEIIEPTRVSPERLYELEGLINADIETAAKEINTLSDYFAFLIIRGYYVADHDIDIYENANLTWHYHKNATAIFNRNYGDCGASSILTGAVLKGDYDDVGIIIMTFEKGQGGGHVINYIEQDGVYYVFDVVNFVGGGFTGSGLNLCTGANLEEAYLKFTEMTGWDEIFAYSFSAFDTDIPVGWQADNWYEIVLPSQYKDEIKIIYQIAKVTYRYKLCTVLDKINDNRD